MRILFKKSNLYDNFDNVTANDLLFYSIRINRFQKNSIIRNQIIKINQKSKKVL